MYVSGYGGRTLLHATSDVRSRGQGPMELHGQRSGPKQVKVTQWINRRGGGHITVRTDRLGTSVGWADIYPADYDKQYVEVSGLRGCFEFRMTVDPKHLLFESDEHDNSSHRRVRLPFTGAGC